MKFPLLQDDIENLSRQKSHVPLGVGRNKTTIQYLVVFTQIISIYKYKLVSILHYESILLRTLKYERASAPFSAAGFHDAKLHMTRNSGTARLNLDANLHMTLTSAAVPFLTLYYLKDIFL